MWSRWPLLEAGPAARQAPEPAPPAGRIAGTIVAAETGQPVRFAKVSLGSMAGDVQVLTDDSGAFTFDGLRVGTYRLHVSKPGYLSTAYGQLRPGTNTLGREIALRDREKMDRLVIQLSRGGSIAGVVRDDRGEPAYHATVAVSRWVMRNGVRSLDTIAQVLTDERGTYRLSLLPPRDYVVSAVPADDAMPSIGTNPNPYGFAPVFYPGQMTPQAAQLIAISVGEERADINLQVPAVPLGKVTGSVVSADGKAVNGARVVLSSGSGNGGDLAASTDSNGRFTFARVLPGSYVASVRVNPAPSFQANRQQILDDFAAMSATMKPNTSYTLTLSGVMGTISDGA